MVNASILEMLKYPTSLTSNERSLFNLFSARKNLFLLFVSWNFSYRLNFSIIFLFNALLSKSEKICSFMMSYDWGVSEVISETLKEISVSDGFGGKKVIADWYSTFTIKNEYITAIIYAANKLKKRGFFFLKMIRKMGIKSKGWPFEFLFVSVIDLRFLLSSIYTLFFMLNPLSMKVFRSKLCSQYPNSFFPNRYNHGNQYKKFRKYKGNCWICCIEKWHQNHKNGHRKKSSNKNNKHKLFLQLHVEHDLRSKDIIEKYIHR